MSLLSCRLLPKAPEGPRSLQKNRGDSRKLKETPVGLRMRMRTSRSHVNSHHRLAVRAVQQRRTSPRHPALKRWGDGPLSTRTSTTLRALRNHGAPPTKFGRLRRQLLVNHGCQTRTNCTKSGTSFCAEMWNRKWSRVFGIKSVPHTPQSASHPHFVAKGWFR